MGRQHRGLTSAAWFSPSVVRAVCRLPISSIRKCFRTTKLSKSRSMPMSELKPCFQHMRLDALPRNSNPFIYRMS